jgi:glycosyltransferase involved in cell wall biosynthesis
MPSYREGLPLALLEALAAGAAAVVTPVGGVRDVLGAGEERGEPVALTSPPGDVAALASAIERLLDDPELRRRLGRAGSERVAAHFSRAAMARATASLYDELRRQSDRPGAGA